MIPPNAKPTSYTLRYRPTQPVAELVALIIGDTVHNLRGALDYLATGIRQSTAWKGRGHFPMRKKREDLMIAGGTPIDDLDAIEAALPGTVHLLLDEIRPSDGVDEALWSFHTLNNDDKHNLILPVIAVASVQGLNAKIGGSIISDCGVGGDATRPINLIGSNAPFSVDDDFNTIVDVKFGERTAFNDKPVVLTLRQIASMVSRTLDQFETLINQRR